MIKTLALPASHPTVASRSERPAPGALQPFRDAQEAWFWTMRALAAQQRQPSQDDTAGSRPARAAMPEDVLRCLDRLYRQRRIDLAHARVLRRWGERGVAPDIRRPGESSDGRLWREALDRLEGALRVRGIVAARAGC